MNRFVALLIFTHALLLSGCATMVVTSAVVGTAATATKVAIKGTVGAGKLAYRGGKAVVRGTARALSDDDDQLAEDRANLPDAD